MKSKPRARGEKNEERNIMRVPNFLKFYATNIHGGISTQDFRFEILNEKVKEDSKWVFVSDAMVILSPTAAKRLHKFLEDAISTYEAEHGVIPTEFPKEKMY